MNIRSCALFAFAVIFGVSHADAAITYLSPGLTVSQQVKTTIVTNTNSTVFSTNPSSVLFSAGGSGLSATVSNAIVSPDGDYAAGVTGPVQYSLTSTTFSLSGGASSSTTVADGTTVQAYASNQSGFAFSVDTVTNLAISYTLSAFAVGDPITQTGPSDLLLVDTTNPTPVTLLSYTTPGSYLTTVTFLPGHTYSLSVNSSAGSTTNPPASAYTSAGYTLKATVAAVPEPASLGLLGVGAVAMLRRRSR